MGIIERLHSEDSRPSDAAAAARSARPEAVAARHHTSLSKDPMYFADLRARLIERYAPARTAGKAIA
jgi:hypothetical protein